MGIAPIRYKFRKKVTSTVFSLLQAALWKIGFDWRRALSPGFSILGFDYFPARRFTESQSVRARAFALSLSPGSVLDVGAGSLIHSDFFRQAGLDVTAIDMGLSTYFEHSNSVVSSGIKFIIDDFNNFRSSEKWDLVWASHVLEHQRNPGYFLEKLISHCAENGHLVVTVPLPHRNLWAGHLSTWSPGILIYNLVLCGIDCSNAEVIQGNSEFSICVSPKKIDLPRNLAYDQGDLEKLSNFLPDWVHEDSDPWKYS